MTVKHALARHLHLRRSYDRQWWVTCGVFAVARRATQREALVVLMNLARMMA